MGVRFPGALVHQDDFFLEFSLIENVGYQVGLRGVLERSYNCPTLFQPFLKNTYS